MPDATSIHHLALEVADLQRSVRFYTELMGLEQIAPDHLPEEGEHVCLRSDKGSLLVLVEVATPRPLWPGACAYFVVSLERWEEIHSRLQQEGLPDIGDPKGGMRAAGEQRLRVRDPDGYALELHAYAPAMYEVPAARRGKIVAGRIQDFSIGTVRRFAEGKFYLVHRPAGFLAISEVCTHREFSVVYQPEHFRFACALHGNRFSPTGALIHKGARGATPPLHVYPIEFVDGRIVVDTDRSIPRIPAEADVMVPVPSDAASAGDAASRGPHAV